MQCDSPDGNAASRIEDVVSYNLGERYKTFPKESKAMLRGEYGQLPGEVNEEVRAKAGFAPQETAAPYPHLPLQPRRPNTVRELYVEWKG